MATGSILGSVGLGVTGLLGSKSASDAAQSSADMAMYMSMQYLDEMRELGQEGIDYAQSLIDDWEQSFGSVESNLADYYNNLDPDKYSAELKRSYQDQLQKSMTQFNETLAQSGLATSGMSLQAAKEASFDQAAYNAGVDYAADDIVAQKQGEWLSFGENRYNQAVNSYNSALAQNMKGISSGYSSALGQQNAMTNMYSNSASGYSSMAGNMLGGALGIGVNASNPNSSLSFANDPLLKWFKG